jgi:hypothetical protein
MKNPAARPQGILTKGIVLYHIRSLTPQQAAGNALAIRFKTEHGKGLMNEMIRFLQEDV